MADKAHGTRQKLVFRLPATKPRNPLVAPAIKRAAGPHRKSSGARRNADELALRKALAQPDTIDRTDDE